MRVVFALLCLSATSAWALVDLPVTFERNQGQWPRSVEYGAHIGGHLYTFGGKGIVIDGTIRIGLISSAKGKLEGLDAVDTKTNYLTGRDARKWIIGVPNYTRIRRRNAFPGVDLVLYGSHGQLEFDFQVAPGADTDLVRFHVAGASVRISPGSLKVTTPSGEIIELHTPMAYQESILGRQTVQCRFQQRKRDEISFATAEYDRARPLVIDPVLTYLKGLGGTGTWQGNLYPVVTDTDGNFYLGGGTLNGNVATTPGVLRSTTPCPSIPPSATYCDEAWVMKFSPKDNGIVWATYVGYSGLTYGQTLALDPAGNVVLGGYTRHPDFPVTPDAYLPTLQPGFDGFLAKLNPSGTALVYATYLEEAPTRMKVDSHGAIYYTSGGHIAKMSADGSTRLYWIQTHGSIRGVTDIAIDDSGSLYGLSDPSTDFPVTPEAYRTSDSDPLFIVKFDPLGKLVFSASFNAPFSPWKDIDVDPSGNIVFTGIAGNGFPVTNDPDPQPNGCDPETPCMAYVAALDSTGSSLLYARLLGHGRGERLAFGPEGDVYVAGTTDTTPFFPRTHDAFQYCSNPPYTATPDSAARGFVGPLNGFLMRLDSQGNRKFSSYLGVTGPSISHLRLDENGNLFVGGTKAVGPYFVEVIGTIQAQPMPHACLVNATQNVPDSDQIYLYVAPGEMVTLFGEGLGPQDPASAEWNTDGSLSTSLTGAQVLFDGIPAPMLYAQANQINCIVPFGVGANATTTIVAQYAGNQTPPMTFHVWPAILTPFTRAYWPGSDVIAINEDGTMNSADHPAPRGSVVAIFAIGGGQTNPPLQDGQIAPGAAQIANKLYAVGFFTPSASALPPADVQYAGAAPGQVAGVYQLNVKVPVNAATGHTYVGFVTPRDPFNSLTETYGGIWLQ